MPHHRSHPLWSILLLVGLVVWLLPSPAGAVHGDAEVSIRGVAQAEGDEGGTTFTFPIDVDAPLGFTDEEIRITYETVDGTATSPEDFEAVQGGEVVIPAGPSPSGQIDITVHGDTELEPHETFEVHLLEVTAGDAVIVDGEATGTVWNDDPPGLSVSDGTGQEGEGITFFVRMSHRTVDEVQVHVATRDGTATAGEDYEPFDGTVTIPPHTTEQTIVIDTLEDDVDEQDETFFVELSDPVNATLEDATGEGHIVQLTVDAGPAATGESATEVGFTGSASGTPPYTFTWDFGDGSASEAGATVNHRFAETGTFTVTLTVEDASGASETDTTTATITDSGQVNRSSGLERISTAIDVSSDHWSRADTVLLATAYNYPDALAAGPLSKKLDAPLLLTGTDDEAPDNVKAELDRLNAKKVIILGGAQAVPQGQADDLAASGYQIQRIADVSRFGTAADIATTVGPTPDNEVTVALGAHSDPDRTIWADSLSAGSFASLPDPLPALLTHSDFVPQETLDALEQLDTEKVFLLGGTKAISPAVEAQLEAEGYTVQRVAGQNRFETSVEAGKIAMGRYPAGQVHPVLATGSNFPDGLTSGALAGKVTGPVVLVTPDDLGNVPGTRQFLRDNANRFDVGTVVGGEKVVSENVRAQARSDIDAS